MSEDRRTPAQEIRDLTRAMRALEERVESLEASRRQDPAGERTRTTLTPAGSPTESAALTTRSAAQMVWQRVPTLMGRLLLVLGGAYLLRALTAGETVPPAAGAGLGYVYGLVWVGVAHRTGGRGDTIGATWHGLAASLIAVPLIWETSAHFEILSFNVAAAMLVVATVLVLEVSRRHGLATLAGLITAGAGACAVVTLVPNPSAAVPMNAALLAIGMASLWIGWSRDWMAPPWCGGLAAVAGGSLLVYGALTGAGPAPGYAVALLLPLFLLYVGSFVVAALRGWQRLDGFAVTQTALALLVGFGGASRIVQQAGTGQALLGLGSIGAAIAIYLLAFTVLDRERRRCFQYLTSLALVLVLAGSAFLLEHPAIPWSLLSVAILLTGRRLGRATLAVHAVAYASAAVLASGLWADTLEAWTTRGAQMAGTPSSWLAFGALAIATLWPVPVSRDKSAVWSEGAHGTATVLLLMTLGGLVLRGAVAIVPSTLHGDVAAPWQAAARTAALALVAIGAALAARGASRRLMSYAVVGVLAAGALKLVIEDLGSGHPASLAVSFGAYGAALILAPRILRARAEPHQAEEGEVPSTPSE